MAFPAAVRRLLPEEFLREKKYDVGSVVAQGGMGAILDAKDATTERKVAMKVMPDGSSPEDWRSPKSPSHPRLARRRRPQSHGLRARTALLDRRGTPARPRRPTPAKAPKARAYDAHLAAEKK